MQTIIEMVPSLLLWQNIYNLSLRLSTSFHVCGPMLLGLGWKEEPQDNGHGQQEVDSTHHIAEDQPNCRQVFHLADKFSPKQAAGGSTSDLFFDEKC